MNSEFTVLQFAHPTNSQISLRFVMHIKYKQKKHTNHFPDYLQIQSRNRYFHYNSNQVNSSTFTPYQPSSNPPTTITAVSANFHKFQIKWAAVLSAEIADEEQASFLFSSMYLQMTTLDGLELSEANRIEIHSRQDWIVFIIFIYFEPFECFVV